MNTLELSASVKTIIRQCQRELAQLAPDSPSALEYVVARCWSDSATVSAAVRAEAEWLSETTDTRYQSND